MVAPSAALVEVSEMLQKYNIIKDPIKRDKTEKSSNEHANKYQAYRGCCQESIRLLKVGWDIMREIRISVDTGSNS